METLALGWMIPKVHPRNLLLKKIGAQRKNRDTRPPFSEHPGFLTATNRQNRGPFSVGRRRTNPRYYPGAMPVPGRSRWNL